MLRNSLLLFVSTTFAFLACSSDPVAPAGPGDDAGVPAATGTGSDTSVAVTVTGLQGFVPGVEVVFHDASGAVLGTTRTGADGNAFSDSAGVSMVTAAVVHSFNRRLFTWTNVQPGERLQLSETLPTDPVGSYIVTATGTTPGDFVREARIGRCSGEHFAQEANDKPIEIRLRPDCLGTAPLTVAIEGRDSEGAAVQAFQTNASLPAIPGASVSVSAPVRWAPARTPTGQLSFVGFPDTAKPFYSSSPVMSALLYDELQFTQLDPTRRYTFGPYITAPHDAYQVQVEERTSPDARRGLIVRGAIDASPEIAYGAFLPQLTDAKLDRTNGARPLVSWAGDTSTAAGGIVNLAYDVDGGTVVWSIVIAPASARALAPALPVDLAGWAPTTAINRAAVVFVRSDILDAPRFRATYGKLLNLWTRSDAFPVYPALPANGTLAWSGALTN